MTLDDLIASLQKERERLGRSDVAVTARQADGATHMREVIGVDDTFESGAVIMFSVG